MNEHSLHFLKQLLRTPGPSCYEVPVARIWRTEASSFADEVLADVHGNSFAVVKGTGPRVLLAGHIDEIGLMVSYIDDDGYLFFEPIGGWDGQVLVGQRIHLVGKHGYVSGVIGAKPIHLLKPDERDNAIKLDNLWIDIGAKNRNEALEVVGIGCVGVVDVVPSDILNRRIVSRGLDNRVGAFIVLEVLRLLAEHRPTADVVAVATTQEEIGSAGAATAAFSFNPHVALVVDVTFSTDYPEADKKRLGDIQLGSGPVLSPGGPNNPLVYERLRSVAEQESIPYTVQVSARYSLTDADDIYRVRAGVATGLLSIPNRYMHSPNEMVDLHDVEHTIRLMAAFVRSLQSENEFVQN